MAILDNPSAVGAATDQHSAAQVAPTRVDRLIRAADQLCLTLEFLNLDVDPTGRTLVTVDPRVAFTGVRMVFGSQHTAEATVDADEEAPTAGVDHRRAAESRLVVALPSGTPYALKSILDLAGRALVLDERAVPSRKPSSTSSEPSSEVTALELVDSLIFLSLYGIAVWLALMALSPHIVALFDATGGAAAVISFFCVYASLGWAFNGAVFVGNAAFNNLGFPTYSTALNWGRATIGTIPFAYAGAWLMGPARGAEGIIAGQAVGGILFAILSMIVCFRVIDRIALRAPDEPPLPPASPSAQSPFTSGKGATAGS